MKFRTNRDTLLRPLQVLTGVIERRHTLPVMSNILVETGENGLTLRGTDLEVEMVAQLSEGIDIEHRDAAATTVPAHTLSDIWRSLPDAADVTFALEGQRVVLRSGRSRYQLPTVPADEYTRFEAGDGEVNVTLPRADVQRLLARTSFAMANQDIRYFLRGLLLEISSQAIRVVATDGARLAMCTLETGVEGVDRLRAIIPRKRIQDLERLVSDSDHDVHFSLGRSHLQVSQGEYTLTTKLVEGQFPPYEALIPREISRAVTSDREALRRALQRASIVSKIVEFSVEDDQLTIHATNNEQGEAEEVVVVDYGGEGMKVSFNSDLVQDVLGAVDTESVSMSFPEDNKIAKMEAVGDEEPLYLVMPRRQ
ncbi:MAG: DNA polymerase III subunit beta [Pseudomonadales bacterium]|nr:DNA polymerase III subunit beta [Pseudomonadales bacterium]